MTAEKMMADIVERIRFFIAARNGPAKDADGNYIGTCWPMMLEAADEIERLRASAVGAGAREALPLAVRLRDEEGSPLPQMVAQRRAALQSEPVQPAGVRAVLDQVEAKAREWAGHYTPHSDGWNTFILFAEWVETLPSDPVRRTTQPIQRDSTARLDSGEVRQQGE